MSFYVAHDTFRRRWYADPDAMRTTLLTALREANGKATVAAKAMGIKPWLFRQAMDELGVGSADDANRLWPTRLQLWFALEHYRGDRAKAAKHFGVSRDWVTRAVRDYNLGRWVPPAGSPYWRAYRDQPAP